MNSNLCLTYLELPPKNQNRDAPICIFAHGRLANENDLFELAPSLHSKFRVLSVRAPIRMGLRAYGWFHSAFQPHYHATDPAQAENSLKLLQNFIVQIQHYYGVSAEKIFLLGFSQGAVLSLATALTSPHLIGGVVCLSGAVLPSFLPQVGASVDLRNFPIYLSHGIDDDVLSIQCGRTAKTILDQLLVDLTYQEHPMGHEVIDLNFQGASDWLLSRAQVIGSGGASR